VIIPKNVIRTIYQTRKKIAWEESHAAVCTLPVRRFRIPAGSQKQTNFYTLPSAKHSAIYVTKVFVNAMHSGRSPYSSDFNIMDIFICVICLNPRY